MNKRIAHKLVPRINIDIFSEEAYEEAYDMLEALDAKAVDGKKAAKWHRVICISLTLWRLVISAKLMMQETLEQKLMALSWISCLYIGAVSLN